VFVHLEICGALPRAVLQKTPQQVDLPLVPPFRERIDESALTRLSLAARGSAGFAIAVALYVMGVHGVNQARLLLICILLCGLGMVAVHVAVRRRWIKLSQVSVVGTAMFVVGVALSGWGFVLTRSVAFTVITSMLMFTAGVMHLYRSWTLLNLGLALAIWLPVGFGTLGYQFALQALTVGLVATLSIMIHEVTMGYLARLEELRVRDLLHERERHELREKLWHSQRLESLGTLAGGVAHDMNNVLAAVVGLGELVHARTEGDVHDDVGHLLSAARRGADLTRNLLGFSRRGTYQVGAVEVGQLVNNVAKLLAATLPKQVVLDVQHAADTHLNGDVAQLTHALLNLCLNASDAMNRQGRISILTRTETIEPPHAAQLAIAPGVHVLIEVRDTGSGIASDVLPRIFEPFFTTKPAGAGTGLGLAMVYGTMQSHRGAVSVHSDVGKGTSFTLYVPASEATTAVAATHVSPHRAVAQHGRILVVDDEPLVREVTRRNLERAGYEVTVAENGQVGCQRYVECRGFDLVILDMGMPIMGGLECFERLRELDAAVRVVIVSGFADEGDMQRCLEGGAYAFIEKPCSGRQLVDVARQALSGGTRLCHTASSGVA
jgi:signal transduction histidine kinase/ActR/RegA family two-component response regulator